MQGIMEFKQKAGLVRGKRPSTIPRDQWYRMHPRATVSSDRAIYDVCWVLEHTGKGVCVAFIELEYKRDGSFKTKWSEEFVPAAQKPRVRLLEDTRRSVIQ